MHSSMGIVIEGIACRNGKVCVETYEGLADVGIAAGVWRSPMALTEFNLFLRAAKAED